MKDLKVGRPDPIDRPGKPGPKPEPEPIPAPEPEPVPTPPIDPPPVNPPGQEPKPDPNYPVYKDPRITNNVNVSNENTNTVNVDFSGLEKKLDEFIDLHKELLHLFDDRDSGNSVINIHNEFNYGFRPWNPLPLFRQQMFGFQYSQLWGTQGVNYPLGFVVPRFI